MLELRWKYNTATVFTDTADNDTMGQIIRILNQPFVVGLTIRMMPDVHAGGGATVGTVMTITDKVAPTLVGADIGCGMETAVLNDSNVNMAALERAVRGVIPCYPCGSDGIYATIPNR